MACTAIKTSHSGTGLSALHRQGATMTVSHICEWSGNSRCYECIDGSFYVTADGYLYNTAKTSV